MTHSSRVEVIRRSSKESLLASLTSPVRHTDVGSATLLKPCVPDDTTFYSGFFCHIQFLISFTTRRIQARHTTCTIIITQIQLLEFWQTGSILLEFPSPDGTHRHLSIDEWLSSSTRWLIRQSNRPWYPVYYRITNVALSQNKVFCFWNRDASRYQPNSSFIPVWVFVYTSVPNTFCAVKRQRSSGEQCRTFRKGVSLQEANNTLDEVLCTYGIYRYIPVGL